jgi:electron transfer flavoprotein beta subunit
MRAVVLLSIGAHPASGRRRPSHADLAALEVLAAAGLPAWGVYAGPYREVLREYGGYGLERLTVLQPNPGTTPAAAIAEFAFIHGIELILAGARGELPGSDGMLPYEVGHRLGWRVCPEILELASQEGRTEAVAWLGGSLRRRYLDAARSVLVVRPREVRTAYAALRVGRLVLEGADASSADRHDEGGLPASERGQAPSPPWLLPDPAASAPERLAMLRGDTHEARRATLVTESPEAAAARLLGYLRENGLEAGT